LAAFFIASMPSAVVKSGVVFMLRIAPPAAAANENAAASTLLGISTIDTMS
jgi:hypothetical protein